MISDILQVVISLAMAALVYKVAYRRGAKSTVDDAYAAVQIMEGALQDLISAHAGLTEANEEMILLHSSHVGFVLDALDEHVKETGSKLDPDAQHVIDQIRPYYASETIH